MRIRVEADFTVPDEGYSMNQLNRMFNGVEGISEAKTTRIEMLRSNTDRMNDIQSEHGKGAQA